MSNGSDRCDIRSNHVGAVIWNELITDKPDSAAADLRNRGRLDPLHHGASPTMASTDSSPKPPHNTEQLTGETARSSRRGERAVT
jgi:hypothetical protein